MLFGGVGIGLGKNTAKNFREEQKQINYLCYNHAEKFIMKITKSKLKKIIQEEAAAVLLEQAGLSGASFGAPSLPDFNNSYDEDLPPTGEDDATGPYARLLSTLNTLSKASAAAANIPTQEGVAALNHLAVADQLTLNMSMVIDAYNKLSLEIRVQILWIGFYIC